MSKQHTEHEHDFSGRVVKTQKFDGSTKVKFYKKEYDALRKLGFHPLTFRSVECCHEGCNVTDMTIELYKTEIVKVLEETAETTSRLQNKKE